VSNRHLVAIIAPMTVVERPTLRVLGEFGLTGSAGEEIELRSAKAQALLAYLALAGGAACSRDRLAALFWGDTANGRARHNLRQCISTLRKALGPDVVFSDADRVRLDPDALATDAVELERLAGVEDPDALGRVVTLYRGELLRDLPVHDALFEEWVDNERRRFRELACRILDRIVEARTARSQHESAIQALEKRLLIDPVAEEAHRRLMRLLDAAGRRSEALKQFEVCKEALARHLDARPSAATSLLRQALEQPSALEPREPLLLPDRPSVAVLPFDNLAGTAEQTFFSDGMAEDLITRLSCFGNLFVIARASSFAYRGSAGDVRHVGRELGVKYVVSGSVRKLEQRIRISVQLIDALTGNHIWAHRYDRELSDLFHLQDELTETIAATLVGRVEAACLERARRKPPESLVAYEYLLRGKDYHHRYSAEDCERAIAAFERAVELEPDFASAHAWLACALGQQNTFEWSAARFARARAEAQRALQIDEAESECHRLLAAIHIDLCELDRASYHQERAYDLNPNDDRIVCQMGELLTYRGRPEEGLDWILRAMRLNPYHPDAYWRHFGRALYLTGRTDDARATLLRITRLRPADHAFLAASYVRLGRYEQARAEVEQLTTLGRNPAELVRRLAFERDRDREQLLADLQRAASEHA
jgi:TolB-like protein/Tfp pilus assembly protein PilF